MIKTAIRLLYYLLLFLVPLVMSSQTSELFEFNKILVIYSIASIVAMLWGIHVLATSDRVRFIPLLTVPLLVFLLSQLASTAFSIDVHTSLFGYYGRFNGGLVSIIAYFVLFFVFVQVFERDDIQKLFAFSLGTSILVVLWGLPGWFGADMSCLVFTGEWTNTCWTQQFRPSERMFSTLGQPNWLGAYLVIHLCIGLWLVFRRYMSAGLPSNQRTHAKDKHQSKKKHEKQTDYSFSVWTWVYTAFVISIFIGVLLTRSRSALLAAAVCVMLAFVYVGGVLYMRYRDSNESLFKKPSVLIFGVLIIGFAVSTVLFKTGISRIDSFFSFERQQTTSAPNESIAPSAIQQGDTTKNGQQAAPLKQDVSDSFDIRLIVWQGAWELGRRYPFLGSGVETFAYTYYQTRPAAHNLTSEWDFIYNKAHNEFLNYLATSGFIGLGAYLFQIGSVFAAGCFIISEKKKHLPDGNFTPSSFLRNATREDTFVVIILLAYLSILITNFFGFSVTSISIFFYLIPASIALFLPDRYTERGVRKIELSSVVSSPLILGLVLVACFILYAVYQYRTADILYSRATTYGSVQQYDRAIETLEDAMSKRYEHVYQDKMSSVLSQYALLVGYDNQEAQETTNSLIEFSQSYNLQSLQASPENPLYWKTKGRNEYLYYYATDDPSYLTEGLESLTGAKELAPTDPKILHSEALFYSLLAVEAEGDPKEKETYQHQSIDVLDQAIDLKPNFRDAYVLKGQLLVQYGREDEAREVFEFVLENIEPRDTEVLEELEKL